MIRSMPADSEVRPEWFGAKGDDSTDDTDAIEMALEAARMGTLRFGPRTYLVSRPLIAQCVRLVGDRWWRNDQGCTILKANAQMTHVIGGNSNRCGIENLAVLCDKKASSGIRLFHSHDTMIRNVAVRDALDAGVDSDGSTFQMDSVTSYCNSGPGFRIKDCNGSAFRYVRAFLNAGGGMSIEAVAQGSGFAIDGNHVFENNDQFDLYLKGINTCSTITGGHHESKAGVDSIRLENCRHVFIWGTRLTGGDLAGQAVPGRGLSLRGVIEGCTFRDLRMAYSAAPDGYEHVVLGEQCRANVFASCLHLGQAGTPLPLKIDGPNLAQNTVIQ